MAHRFLHRQLCCVSQVLVGCQVHRDALHLGGSFPQAIHRVVQGVRALEKLRCLLTPLMMLQLFDLFRPVHQQMRTALSLLSLIDGHAIGSWVHIDEQIASSDSLVETASCDPHCLPCWRQLVRTESNSCPVLNAVHCICARSLI